MGSESAVDIDQIFAEMAEKEETGKRGTRTHTNNTRSRTNTRSKKQQQVYEQQPIDIKAENDTIGANQQETSAANTVQSPRIPSPRRLTPATAKLSEPVMAVASMKQPTETDVGVSESIVVAETPAVVTVDEDILRPASRPYSPVHTFQRHEPPTPPVAERTTPSFSRRSPHQNSASMIMQQQQRQTPQNRRSRQSNSKLEYEQLVREQRERRDRGNSRRLTSSSRQPRYNKPTPPVQSQPSRISVGNMDLNVGDIVNRNGCDWECVMNARGEKRLVQVDTNDDRISENYQRTSNRSRRSSRFTSRSSASYYSYSSQRNADSVYSEDLEDPEYLRFCALPEKDQKIIGRRLLAKWERIQNQKLKENSAVSIPNITMDDVNEMPEVVFLLDKDTERFNETIANLHFYMQCYYFFIWAAQLVLTSYGIPLDTLVECHERVYPLYQTVMVKVSKQLGSVIDPDWSPETKLMFIGSFVTLQAGLVAVVKAKIGDTPATAVDIMLKRIIGRIPGETADDVNGNPFDFSEVKNMIEMGKAYFQSHFGSNSASSGTDGGRFGEGGVQVHADDELPPFIPDDDDGIE